MSADISDKDPFSQDLVVDSEIETENLGGGCVQHTLYAPSRSPRDRYSKVTQRWERVARLRSSSDATVYKELCRDLKSVRAVKVIKREAFQQNRPAYARELEALAKFSNQRYTHCFVRSYGWFALDGGIAITTEFLEGGALEAHLGAPLSEPEVRSIAKQLLEGLGYMHASGFVHRNLAPENIIVVHGSPGFVVKISDFSCVVRYPSRHTFDCPAHWFALDYASPELLGLMSNVDDESGRSSDMDMWSLGAVVYRLLTNEVPFTRSSLVYYVTNDDRFPWFALARCQASSHSQNFVRALMERTPSQRPAARVALSHPFIELPSKVTAEVTPPTTPMTTRSPIPAHSPIPAMPSRHSPTPVRSPQPSRTPGQSVPLRASRYNDGEKGWVRPELVMKPGCDKTNISWELKNPFGGDSGAAAAATRCRDDDKGGSHGETQQPPQSSAPPSQQTKIKRKPSREPVIEGQRPSLQKRPSLRESDADISKTWEGVSSGADLASQISAAEGLFENTLLRQCNAFIKRPPDSHNARSTEFTRLSEEVMRLVKTLDELELGSANDSIRTARKRLLSKLTGYCDAMETIVNPRTLEPSNDTTFSGRIVWDCPACRREIRFAKGKQQGTYEVSSSSSRSMILVRDSLYQCKCGQESVCLKCGLAEEMICRCYRAKR